ncbi:ROK family protein [Nostoc sp. FACHB-87]|uniref:ROK family protein n=1 Tax=Nostocales TaxID=1161 RepID=UPI0016889FE8|nr:MULTISPECIES: ROK family protein [Nostocales]MBD2301751.1 ROK family protein [Nostoc sp. FACHB-190]MBD2456733.1 ROK family protein [Nostoc sp. FACHB-87]MBD2478012.1 ROK family protein [Anabaena sp. FACHB-83]MBD2490900.1 ROK family protein [Aulosira sp. FACHB-615]
MTLILALDFGGTKLAAAVTQLGSRQWLRYERRLSPTGANATTDLEIMRSLIYNLLQGETPTAIGVSFGGPVDFTTGTVRLSHHVPGWENLPLKHLLEQEFGVPASVDNDANIAALGEHRFGAGQEYDSLFYITISTGVGGGWILNGKPWRGNAGMAGEIGHIVVNPAGPVCLCGKQGCVERLASGPYMAQDAKEYLLKPANHFSGKQLRSLVNDDLDLITGKIISDAVAQGDELAINILQGGAWALGVGIGNVANLINPQRFILGGSVTKAGELWWNTVEKTARETALPEIDFEILPAALGDDAPLWGAVALAELEIRSQN